MTEKVNEVKEEVQSDVEQQSKEESPKREVVLITDPMERLAALQEVEILTKLIGTSYFLPRWSKGNGNKIQREITSSIQLNYFPGDQMRKWGNRIIELTEKLGAVNE